MITRKKNILIAVLLCFGLWSCQNEETISDRETTVKGSISVAIDQAFQPIMEQQLKVWDSSYPNAKITPVYTSEQEAYRLLMEDTIRMIITSRDISGEQKEWGKSRKIVFHSMALARAGYAVIIHPGSPDDKMTLGILRNILSNDFVRKYKVVFDQSGSAAFHFVMDEVLKGHPLDTSNVFAAGSHEKVIEYVSKTPGTLGFVSINHIYKGSQNEGNSEFVDGVQVVALQGEDDKTGDFYQPYMGYLYTRQYPLCQDVYFVTKETWRGVATGFINFLSQPAGQLLFYKAWMVPLRSNVEFKEAVIKTR